MWVIYLIMIKNKEPTILVCVEDIFIPFLNDRGEIEISENLINGTGNYWWIGFNSDLFKKMDNYIYEILFRQAKKMVS